VISIVKQERLDVTYGELRMLVLWRVARLAVGCRNLTA
jgi:hypothetical protein